MRCQLSASLLLAGLALAAPAAPAAAQSAADSTLVRGILTAEDRRDSLAAALREGLASRDPRIQLLARRARARITDPKFASRDSLPPLPPAPVYPDPAWRLRYRALAAKPIDCGRITAGLADSVWHVRLRAADLVAPDCATDPAILATLRRWVAATPTSARRTRGDAGWRPAAHALVALAKASPADARAALPRYATNPVPWVRVYAAHAATALSDTTVLRRLAADPNDNVKEAAIGGLSKVAGHDADDVYLRSIAASGYQAVRAAAMALKGAPDSARVASAARAASTRLAVDSLETAKDARVALDALTGRRNDAPASARPVPLGRDAVALALGREYRLRVTLADSSGGGSFIVRLRGDAAPLMGARILDLVRANWYNGRTWYRVEPDFVIQGGGPGSNEYVGHPRFMRDELSSIPQVRGTVGMSTRGHDTGDAQWFINLRDNQRLTRDYTTWGEVVEGMDVVDGILEGDVIARIEILPAKPHD